MERDWADEEAQLLCRGLRRCDVDFCGTEENIATALRAAERRGMIRAAEIAALGEYGSQSAVDASAAIRAAAEKE